ncbi:uncharacterized protein TNCV_3026921 [Trichonephila clavipes]|nr:uncharacterized protein TNCV_3026921 [Trichonephila clavipes]
MESLLPTQKMRFANLMRKKFVFSPAGRGNRDAPDPAELSGSACGGSRAVGHGLHTSHVPRPHSADGSGDDALKIKLREALFLPRFVAEPMICDGIYIETSGFNGRGVGIPDLLGEEVRMFIPLDVDMSGDPSIGWYRFFSPGNNGGQKLVDVLGESHFTSFNGLQSRFTVRKNDTIRVN